MSHVQLAWHVLQSDFGGLRASLERLAAPYLQGAPAQSPGLCRSAAVAEAAFDGS